LEHPVCVQRENVTTGNVIESMHLGVKVDGNEVGLFVADDERLSEVEATSFVDASNPLLVDLLVEASTDKQPTVSATRQRTVGLCYGDGM